MRRRVLVFVCVSLALCVFLPPASAQVLRQSLEPRQTGVGTPVRYTVIFQSPGDTEVQDPVFSEEPPAPLEVIDRSIKRKRGFLRGSVVVFSCVVRSFETGSFDLPALEIRYRRTGRTEWQSARSARETIEVISALVGQQGPPRLKDIKGPFELRRRFGFGFLLACAALIAAFAGLAGFLKKKKILEESAVEREPAYLIALRELEELQRKDYVSQGRIKEYFIEVSSIVRRYLEGRFNVHAPEMTTEEFLRDARDTSLLAGAHKELLEEFLRCCDLVKFARYAPQSAEIQEVFSSAKKFVEQTQTSA